MRVQELLVQDFVRLEFANVIQMISVRYLPQIFAHLQVVNVEHPSHVFQALLYPRV